MQNERNAHDAQREVTPAEAAALLGVSATTVRRRGAQLGRKVLGRWRINPELVEQALTPAGGAR